MTEANKTITKASEQYGGHKVVAKVERKTFTIRGKKKVSVSVFQYRSYGSLPHVKTWSESAKSENVEETMNWLLDNAKAWLDDLNADGKTASKGVRAAVKDRFA